MGFVIGLRCKECGERYAAGRQFVCSSCFGPLEVEYDYAAIGLAELYLKDDSVNHPTLSYKERVVSVAITRALELGFDTIACASTGNLANSVAAHSARLGLRCFVFVPDAVEPAKIVGSGVYRPRIVRIRTDKPVGEIDTLASALALVNKPK